MPTRAGQAGGTYREGMQWAGWGLRNCLVKLPTGLRCRTVGTSGLDYPDQPTQYSFLMTFALFPLSVSACDFGGDADSSKEAPNGSEARGNKLFLSEMIPWSPRTAALSPSVYQTLR